MAHSWLLQDLHHLVHHGGLDGNRILVTESLQPVPAAKLVKQFAALIRVSNFLEYQGTDSTKHSDPILESIVELVSEEVTDSLGQGRCGSFGSDGDQQVSAAENRRQEEIAGAGIVGDVDPDAALAASAVTWRLTAASAAAKTSSTPSR